jgi:hypothetical protein
MLFLIILTLFCLIFSVISFCLVVLCLLWLTQKHQPQRHHNLLVVRDHSFTSDQASRRHCARTGAARTRGEGEYRGGEGWGNGKRIEWL